LYLERAFEPLSALGNVTSVVPELRQGSRQLQDELVLA
jgi:hypothetical protein